jgi:hypothetical protein
MAAVLVPLPAVTFVWWALIVRPVWMPEPLVRQALLIAYLLFAPVCLIGLFFKRRMIGETMSLLSFATLLLCGGSVFLYPRMVGVYLAILGTTAGAAAVAFAGRLIWHASRPIADRRMANHLLVVLPATMAAIVVESALWPWDTYNLPRLMTVCACALALWGGIGRWRHQSAPFLTGLIYTAAGLLVVMLAEALRLHGGQPIDKAPIVLQSVGRFLAYFGAAMSLSVLPDVARSQACRSDSDRTPA